MGTDGGHSSLGCVICQKSHLCFVMYCGDRRGCHFSLGCVICQKSHLCFIMYCGDRRGSLLIRVCHLSKITFMFCHVLWGQTGVSLLIRVYHLLKITFMFCHALWGQTRGGHSSLGCVICQKSHLCITCKLTFVWFQLNVSPVTLVTCSDNTTGDDYIFKQLSPC